MRFKHCFFLLLCLLIKQSTVISQIECSKSKSKQQLLKSNRLNLQEIAETEKYDVKFYKLDLELSDQSNFIQGIVTIKLKSITSLDSILLELHENLTIDDLKINAISNAYHRSNSSVIIEKELAKNSLIDIQIIYHGSPPNSIENPLGGSGLNNTIDDETNTKVTYSLSEPFSAYEWWPCKQSLNDKADSCYVYLTVPNNCLAGSNGVLKNKFDLGNGNVKFEWQHIHPIDYYLISVAVAQYQEYSYTTAKIENKNILVQNYIYNDPDFFNKWKENIDSTEAYLKLFSQLYGLYPFYNEKYGHCTAPLGGGMEHQTMTTQIHFDKNLTAHELAHQWFGNNVTCSSWSDIWINEGFATYSQYLMLEKLYPDEALAQIIAYQNKSMEYLDGSIFVKDSLNTSRIFDYRLTYSKGAAFIHTLRYIINNDELFFKNLKSFQEDFSGKTASAEDIKLYLTKNSDNEKEITEAFDQLYYGEGFPTYSLKWNTFGNNLLVEVSQVPSGAFLTQLFTQPLEISLKLKNNKDTIIKINIENQTQKFYIDNIGEIEEVREIDPNNWLIKKIDTIYFENNLDLSNIDNFTFDLVEISPNPFQDKINITVNQLGTNNLIVYNTIGEKINTSQFEKHISIDARNYPSGTYILRITTNDNKKIIKKIIKS